MNFFVCLVRLNGEPITAADRRPIVEHLVSKGIDGGTGWEDAGSLSALVRRAGESGPRLARAGSLVGVGHVRLDNPESDPSAPATHLELALRVADAAKLLGDFAYVTWDPDTLRLVAARDAFGVRPLFYCRLASDLIAFSSHASLLGVNGKVNENYLANFFVRSVSDEDTIFDSVEVVPAAHTLSVTDGRWSVSRYWSPDRFDIDPGSSVEELRALFADSVRFRLDGQGAVWSELSGGLDTSAIVSTSSWLHRSGAIGRGVSGTITYADSLGSGDESEFVDAVVQTSGVRNEQVRDSWPWRNDAGGPLRTEMPGPGTLFWFRDRRRNQVLRDAGAEVLLSGLGGDHVLEGNLRFFADQLASGSIRRTAGELAHWAALKQKSFWKLAYRLGVVPLLPAAARARLTTRESNLRIPSWVAGGFRKRSNLDARLRRTSVPRLPKGALPRYRGDNIEQVGFLASSLPRDNPFVTYERRFPFLYRPLVELTLRLRPELKVHPYARKVGFREAMRGVLPEAVRTRRGKGGVDTRMLWTLNHERRLIESMLRDPLLAQMGYVDAASLRGAYEAARTGKQRLTVPLFNTLALETWLLIEAGRWSHVEAQSTTHFSM